MKSLDQCKLHILPQLDDERGSLSVFEFEKILGFRAKRLFHVYNVKEDRGGHAHKFTNQIIMSTNGVIKVEVFNGMGWNVYVLDHPTKALYTPKMTFLRLCDFSIGAVCTVLSDTRYNKLHSIRTFEQFIEGAGIGVH